ncbi:ABC transporter permease [Roseofilum sp. Guam]|uniref:ABC transporter permease n=1 Tax=Roseofilum sp. Guam TaxID=2821502 RepID=UPI001B10A41F|nr:ABC transporter permease [Roseofilum sp. Guam]MBP0028570.1 ABC transporter permease [Roseofilum sp. Guam]
MNQPITNIKQKKEDYYTASQWQLFWSRFKTNRLAALGGAVLSLFIFIALFAEFIAPYSGLANDRNSDYTAGPPQLIRLCDSAGCQAWPFVHDMTSSYSVLEKRYKVEIIEEDGKPVRRNLRFFHKAGEYKLFGIIPGDRHLFGTDRGKVHLFGTDSSGLDLFSRVMFATRTSLTIGFLGIMISFILSLFFGGVAGYIGGWVDTVIQAFTNLVRVIPPIPLYMALTAMFPRDWSNQQVYFAMTLVMGLVNWPTLARRIRSYLLASREEEYVLAAQLCGASGWRIVTRHLLPGFASYIIVELVINFPYRILDETALSIVGLGLRRPTMSWGVLLQEMTTVQAIQLTPWFFIPLIFFVVAVLSFTLLGDGLRDAADPYSGIRR